MDGIRIEVRLERDGVVIVVDAPAAAGLPLQVVAGIDLHTGQVGRDVEDDARPIGLEARDVALGAHEAIPAVPGLHQHEVVVEPLGIRDGTLVAPHALAELLAVAQVERGAIERDGAARGNQVLVGLGVGIGRDGQAVIKHGTGAVEVEVAVVRHADGRAGRRRAVVGHGDGARAVELIGHVHVDLAGEALVAVGREQAELNGAAVLELLGAHDLPLAREPVVRAAVVAVLAVVLAQLVRSAVELEGGAGDAVDHAPDDGADKLPARHVARRVVVAQHHVHELAGRARHLSGDEARAHIGYGDLHAGLVRDREELCFSPIGEPPECTTVDLHVVLPER